MSCTREFVTALGKVSSEKKINLIPERVQENFVK